MNTSFTILVLVLACTRGSVVWFEKCPEMPVKSTLDLNQYSGLWYEIQKFPAWFELDMKCITANYTLKDDGHIEVVNKGYRRGTKFEAIGDAYVPDAKDPAKLLVRFSEASPYGLYWVLDTDYTTYSLVYTCREVFLGFVYIEYAWILSRDKTISESKIKMLHQELKKLNIQVDHFVTTDQTHC